MKKYWQLLLIAGVIVVSLSVHYIQVVNAKNTDYQFTFDKISGDDKYLDSLVIEANVEYGGVHGSVLINEEETILRDSSDYNKRPLVFQNLIDEHKNFMRGKALLANNYFEDDTKLVYVKDPEEAWKVKEGETYSYKIDVLDKVKDTTSSFEIQSQLKSRLNWVYFSNLTVVDNELKLLVRQVDQYGSEQLYLVIIDLKKQQLLSESLIDEVANDENTSTSINSYNTDYNFGHEKYHIYSVDSYDLKNPEYNLLSRQFHAFNIETNEVAAIQLPEGLDQKLQSISVDDNYLVIAYSTSTEKVIHRYNIGQQRWLDPVNLPQPMNLNNELNGMSAQNGKLYLMNGMDTDYMIQIFDIEKGILLYEGKLSNSKQKYNIWVSNFYDLSK
ncbi:hypothetical protein A9986_10565 [Solibacillus silvestris]|nr:hypothetical protein [Solibacillus silvestris]OBW57177.1 hypothetical protein A9986_10565 [Solibacillus silvestris]